MGPFAALLSSLIITDIGASVSRYKRNAALWAVVGVLVLTAYIFALVAGAIYLSILYTPLIAAIALAVGFLVMALIIVAIMGILNARDKRVAAERRRRSQAKTNIAIATAFTLFRRQPLLAAGLALGAGTILGLSRKSDRHQD